MGLEAGAAVLALCCAHRHVEGRSQSLYRTRLFENPKKSRRFWFGSAAPLLVALLLLDLPLGLLYGLKSELRHLSRSLPGAADAISSAYSAKTMSPALAINNGPEDLLSQRLVDFTKYKVLPVAVTDPVHLPTPQGHGSEAVTYGEHEFIPPPPRPYDPLGPPSRHL